jgi:hypothetical protein
MTGLAGGDDVVWLVRGLGCMMRCVSCKIDLTLDGFALLCCSNLDELAVGLWNEFESRDSLESVYQWQVDASQSVGLPRIYRTTAARES